MLQAHQESEFNYSAYISSEEEEIRKELAARPVDKEVLMKAMSLLKLEGEWRITQTACGLIISFLRETDLLQFQELDISTILGMPVTVYFYSALDTYRQRLLIRDVPWALSDREVETALVRQGVLPLSLTRSRHGHVIIELGDPVGFNTLMQEGFDFFASARFATNALMNVTSLPPTPSPRPDFSAFQNPRDNILQCYKCQGFWHYAAQCPGSQRCVRCGGAHPVIDCPRPRNDPVCLHCSGRHHAAYKHCPVRQQMKAFLPLPPLYLPAYLPPPASYTQ